ncbi:MAG: hypothetical protein CMP28_10800 [Roseibacillus sp.]|nr:hypothetical protein [Roseibacillus sp.]
MKSRSIISLCSILALLAANPPTHASEILGIGTGALLGGDLTDPEDDGSPDANTNYNAVFASSSKQNFGPPEGAFNVFDNRIGGGNDKWCCGNDPNSAQWVQATFDQPVTLSHFTIASGNDTPGRDPVDWEVQGSNDGVNFTTIFSHAGSNLWTARNQVIRWDGGGVDFATPPSYTTIRLATTATGLGGGAFSRSMNSRFSASPISPTPTTTACWTAGRKTTDSTLLTPETLLPTKTPTSSPTWKNSGWEPTQ